MCPLPRSWKWAHFLKVCYNFKVEQKKQIAKYILGGIGVAAAAGTILVFPGMGLLLKWIMNLSKSDFKSGRKSFYDLKRRGMIKAKTNKGAVQLVLTEKGKRQFERYKLKSLTIEKPKHWDGFWRIVMFDVPESNRDNRDAVRLMLKQLGFVRVQKSVFIHPFPCTDIIWQLRSQYKLGEGDLYVFEAKVLEGEKVLKKHFHLTS